MRRRGVLRGLFLAAACLSFLLNAAVLGLAIRAYSKGIFPFGPLGMGLISMPAERRTQVLEGLRPDLPELRALLEAVQARREEMIAVASADPVDAAKLEAALAEMRAATAQLQGALHESVLESLTAEQDR
ncbi:MAG: periplasmic heavy metal sensor [Pseudomonadota bacterium]